MFTAEQYRAKAAEYAGLMKQTDVPREVREFHDLQRSFSVLADNEEWLADNYQKTIHTPDERDGSALAEQEEHSAQFELWRSSGVSNFIQPPLTQTNKIGTSPAKALPSGAGG